MVKKMTIQMMFCIMELHSVRKMYSSYRKRYVKKAGGSRCASIGFFCLNVFFG